MSPSHAGTYGALAPRLADRSAPYTKSSALSMRTSPSSPVTAASAAPQPPPPQAAQGGHPPAPRASGGPSTSRQRSNARCASSSLGCSALRGLPSVLGSADAIARLPVCQHGGDGG